MGQVINANTEEQAARLQSVSASDGRVTSTRDLEVTVGSMLGCIT